MIKHFGIFFQNSNGKIVGNSRKVFNFDYNETTETWEDVLAWYKAELLCVEMTKNLTTNAGCFVLRSCLPNGNILELCEYKEPLFIYDENALLHALKTAWPQPNNQAGENCPLAKTRPDICPTEGVCPKWCYDNNYFCEIKDVYDKISHLVKGVASQEYLRDDVIKI